MSDVATDSSFNAESRNISMKLDIYFEGSDKPPLSVYKYDYLIDCSWLEESSAESTTPFGAISSNEMTFRLHNKDGMFSPTNTAGPYFGLIKPGVKVVPYIRPADNFDWLQLGEYFVTGWDAAITGIYADITANDKWQKIFNSSTPNYRVERNVTHKQALDNIFASMGHTVLVSDSLNKLLLFSFIEGAPLSFLSEILAGAMAYCTCNKLGEPIIEPFIKARPVRATLTDSDQIKVVTAVQSIIKAYDGVEFTYCIPQISEQEKLADIQKLELQPGSTSINNIAFSKSPVWLLKYVAIDSSLNETTLEDCTHTSGRLNLLLNNTHSENAAVDIAAYGNAITFTNVILTDRVDNLLGVLNRYVQDAFYASVYKSILESIVNNNIPTLSVSIRGNPLLNIGDRVKIQSTRYGLNYDGVIQRLSYTYSGSLSCEMTLMNNATLQGVI